MKPESANPQAIDAIAEAILGVAPLPLDPPTRPRKASEIVARILRDAEAENLVGGDRLPAEGQMMSRYETGRASVREALRILEIYGLVEMKRGKDGGPVLRDVNPVTIGDTLRLYLERLGGTYSDLLDARVVIDPALVRQSASCKDEKLITRLRGVLAADAILDHQDRATIMFVTSAYYKVLGQMAGNVLLDLIGQAIREILGRRRSEVHRTQPVHAEQVLRRRRIAEAVIDGDADLAEKLAREHLAMYSDMERDSFKNLLSERVRWE